MCASIFFDFIIQLVVLIGISTRQVKCEADSKPLALDIHPIVSLTRETYDLVKDIFANYEQPNALLQLEFTEERDEDDELLDQIARDLDLECGDLTPRNTKPKPKLEIVKAAGKGGAQKPNVMIMEKKS